MKQEYNFPPISVTHHPPQAVRVPAECQFIVYRPDGSTYLVEFAQEIITVEEARRRFPGREFPSPVPWGSKNP